MQPAVDRINDLVYNFQRSNHYYPGCLYIGSEVLESLIRELEDQLTLGSSGSLERYMDMRVIKHANASTCYVQ